MSHLPNSNDYYDDLSRLNNELVNSQRNLAKANAELRQKETSLKVERDFAESLLNTAQIIILVLDLSGRIVRLNSFLEVLAGYPGNEVTGKYWIETLIATHDRASAEAFFQATLKGIRSTGCILQLETKDRRKIDAEWKTSLLRGSNGETNGMLVIGLDITQRKRTEELLQNSQKLQSLGLLASGIAHNFNNLLGGIYGYLDLANGESNAPNTSKYLAKALATIDRANNLTAELLTFSQGGAPSLEIAPLFPFVENAVQFALSDSNVSCRFDVTENLCPCSFDKNQLFQVIANIVTNARQAMPDGGLINVKASNCFLEKERHPLLNTGNYVKISIKDHGIGMSKEILAHAFDPFFTTKPPAHGLGLATSNSIVKRHGGAIEVDSEPGAGSTFYICLPAATELR